MLTTNETQLELLTHFNQCNCEDCQTMVDYGTWRNAYVKGYREPRYPVPAHHYRVSIREDSVEIDTGLITMWYPSFPPAFRGPYYDVDLVFYACRDYDFWEKEIRPCD